MAYLVMFCILLSERAHALIPPPQAAVTPRAVLLRAMETLGWFSAGAANGSTTCKFSRTSWIQLLGILNMQ